MNIHLITSTLRKKAGGSGPTEASSPSLRTLSLTEGGSKADAPSLGGANIRRLQVWRCFCVMKFVQHFCCFASGSFCCNFQLIWRFGCQLTSNLRSILVSWSYWLEAYFIYGYLILLDALCTFSRKHRISDSKMLNPDSLTALPKSPWVRDQPNMVNIASLDHGEELRPQISGVPWCPVSHQDLRKTS